MKNLTWWFRVVGVYYLLAGAANVVYMFASPEGILGTLPYDPAPDVASAFNDAWLPFSLGLVAVGLVLLWASRRPAQSTVLVWLVIALEILHGVVSDAIWISRGYDAASYGVFIVVHLAIVVWGLLALRSASRVTSTREHVAA